LQYILDKYYQAKEEGEEDEYLMYLLKEFDIKLPQEKKPTLFEKIIKILFFVYPISTRGIIMSYNPFFQELKMLPTNATFNFLLTIIPFYYMFTLSKYFISAILFANMNEHPLVLICILLTFTLITLFIISFGRPFKEL